MRCRERGVKQRLNLYSVFKAAASVVVLIGLMGCASTDEKHFLKTDSEANVWADKYRNKEIHKVAIMPFKAPTELIGTSISDLFVTEMLRADKYTLVERSQMTQVLQESELALSGLTDAQAIEVAQIMGADGVIVGTVSEYTTVAYRGHPYPSVGVSARLIDSDSGKIVWSVDLAKRADSKKTTLSAHARNVVHEMCAGLYQRWDRQKKKK